MANVYRYTNLVKIGQTVLEISQFLDLKDGHRPPYWIFLARSANLPTELYILPFVISSFLYSEQSYLSIYWTDFHDLFTKWKVFA